jgi:hypothetical protein
MVTSHAQNDSGLFEFSLRDERYLPFEGAGVVSSWRIELMADRGLRQFDYDTVSDVILHLRFTARDGGLPLRQAAVAALKTTIAGGASRNRSRLFSARHEVPDAWHRFLRPTDAETSHVLAMKITPERFSFLFRGQKVLIKSVAVFWKLQDRFAFNIQSFAATFNGTPGNFSLSGSRIDRLPFAAPSVAPIEVPGDLFMRIEENDLKLLGPPTAKTWWQQVMVNGSPHARLVPDAVEDVWILAEYSVQAS